MVDLLVHHSENWVVKVKQGITWNFGMKWDSVWVLCLKNMKQELPHFPRSLFLQAGQNEFKHPFPSYGLLLEFSEDSKPTAWNNRFAEARFKILLAGKRRAGECHSIPFKQNPAVSTDRSEHQLWSVSKRSRTGTLWLAQKSHPWNWVTQELSCTERSRKGLL